MIRYTDIRPPKVGDRVMMIPGNEFEYQARDSLGFVTQPHKSTGYWWKVEWDCGSSNVYTASHIATVAPADNEEALEFLPLF